MSKVLIAIVGPTGIGKTGRAISLAKHLNTDVFSCDSRQFFKEMSIGTAVPSSVELNTAKHHFIQHKSIFDSYSVGDFEREAIQALEKLFSKNDRAVLVGGSALYMDAILYGLDNFPEVKPEIREGLNTLLKKKGISALQTQLKNLDSKYHAVVDLNNPHRLIRALEISISSGRPYSSFLNQQRVRRKFQYILLGLQAEREVIYERINQRVDQMVENGLVQEAEAMYPNRHLNALNTVGYKELFDYFEGTTSMEKAISEIKKNTRRFAKRQLTWYRKNTEVHWLDYDLPEEEFINAVELKIKKVINASD